MMKNVVQYNVQEMSLEDTIKVEGGFRIYNINHIYFYHKEITIIF